MKTLIDNTSDRLLYPSMSEATSRTFMVCSLNEQAFESLPGKDEPPSIRVLNQRLDWARVEATTAVKYFVSELSKGIPGRLVMWAWSLRKLYIDNGCKKIDMSALTYACPNGFPVDQIYTDVWDAQKDDASPLGNKLDVPTNWTI